MDIEEYKNSMPRCKDCMGFGWGECKTAGENEVACKDFERKPKLTNADRIRQMTDEELAEFLDKDASYTCRICTRRDAKDSCCDYVCKECVTKWLKQEVSEDAAD